MVSENQRRQNRVLKPPESVRECLVSVLVLPTVLVLPRICEDGGEETEH